MRWLSLLSRVAFICNLFFVLCLILQWKLFISNAGLVSTTIILGYLLAPFVANPLVNIAYLSVLLQRKPVTAFVPKWLAVANFIFLLLQIFFVLRFIV